MPIRNKQAAREAKQAQLPKLAGDKKRFLWKSFIYLKIVVLPKKRFWTVFKFSFKLSKITLSASKPPSPGGGGKASAEWM